MFNKKAFTLVEIITVLVILSILSMIAIPNYNNYQQQGAAKAAQNNLITIYNAQKAYFLNNTSSYCTAACGSETAINGTLSLNITDNNFAYACSGLTPNTCTATPASNPVTLSINLKNPIILTGGTGCTTAAGASCNPSCSPTTSIYCP